MKVRAKFVSENGREKRVVGYFGDIRIREGQIFEILPKEDKNGNIISAEKQFSKKWMERLDAVKAPAPEKTLVKKQDGEPEGFDSENSQPGSEQAPSAEGAAVNSGSNSDVI